jgi:HSP20 family protein
MALTGFSTEFPSFLERFFDNDWRGRSASDYTPASATLPMVNIMENADEYLIEVAAPGMKKDNFKVQYDNGKLTISSDQQEEAQDGVSFIQREYNFQSFQRSFDVSEDLVDGEKIHANYHDGILQITLPKREEVKPKPGREISIL